MGEEYSDARKRFYEVAFEELDSEHKNYQKYYYAANKLLDRGKYADYAVTVIGTILLFGIGGLMVGMYSYSFDISVALFIVTTILTTTSFLTAKESFSRNSKIYYNAGQVHHELYQEMRDLIVNRFTDPEEDIDDLIRDFESLLKRKNELNRATPQLRDKWYQKMKKKNDVDLPKVSLNEMSKGNWDPE